MRETPTLISFGLRVDNERNIQPSIDLRDENFFRNRIRIRDYGGRRFQEIKSYMGELKTTADFQFLFDLRLQGYFS